MRYSQARAPPVSIRTPPAGMLLCRQRRDPWQILDSFLAPFPHVSRRQMIRGVIVCFCAVWVSPHFEYRFSIGSASKVCPYGTNEKFFASIARLARVTVPLCFLG